MKNLLLLLIPILFFGCSKDDNETIFKERIPTEEKSYIKIINGIDLSFGSAIESLSIFLIASSLAS